MVFRFLYQKILFFLSFLLSCKYYFFIFFLFPDFSSISLLLFYQFWTKLIFWKIILGSILWLVHNVSPLCKLEGNNWSNVTTVQVSKKTALCLWTWPTATGSFIAYCFTLFFVSRYCFLSEIFLLWQFHPKPLQSLNTQNLVRLIKVFCWCSHTQNLNNLGAAFPASGCQ